MIQIATVAANQAFVTRTTTNKHSDDDKKGVLVGVDNQNVYFNVYGG